MKNASLRITLATLATLSFSLTGCSKKSEPAASAPTPPPAAPAPAPVAPVKAAADAAKAQLAAAEKEAEALKAKAAYAAKAEQEKLQALADQKAADAKKVADDLKTKANAASTNLLNKASTLSATNSTPAAPATTSETSPATASLTSLAQNLNPANFSSWYEQASKESSGIIASLGAKAAELGSSASPELKSLYETALTQKKTFDDVSSKLKSGGLAQWAELYPTLQNSWSDLSKSLITAKTLLASYTK
ncbi:hypothetical protein CMV30_06210 [Nibricoccus aquaticus]|uniref:Uncharacterized protein n=1 Tax=Nibricoccus aquaticus TaxID=2576891 RepID=A0A290Q4I4_9BACT|nr:hypothetical protein [Nibricoccus aquaticus]ATC63579.1 hypothetical protein CMV30_06210 [Nibricoccus aquaticus]